MKVISGMKKKPTLRMLAHEVSLLRSFVMGTAGRDPEGIYRPEFIADMLRVSTSATPLREFIDARDFLQRVRRSA